jgi:Domain of unknown function (DUF4437)
MSRPLVDFTHTDDLVAVDSMVAGSPTPIRCRTLSVDPHTGGASAVVELPAGWTAPPARWSASLELMVLAGALRLGDQRLSRSGYLFVPAGVALPELRADDATRAVIFTDAAAVAAPVAAVGTDSLGQCIGPVHLSDLAWEQPRTPGFPNGSGRKTLRIDEESGEGFWVLGLLPHWDSAQREWHEFAEENYVLAGEIETAVGMMRPGAYLSHPPGPEFIHGPMRSRPGALVITRTSGPFATTYEPAPAGLTLSGPWP